MTAAAANWLSSDSIQEARKNLVLMFYLLLDELEGIFPSQQAISGWLAVRKLNGAEISSDGTSFFWYFTHRIRAMLEEGTEISPAFWRIFFAQTLDSFFFRLKVGDTFRLPAAPGTAVVLPRLGIRFCDAGEECTVVRSGEHVLMVEWGSGRQRISLLDPQNYRLPRVEIAGGAFLLLGLDSLLPDQVLDQKLARLSDEEGATLGQEIERALKLIETADPVLLQKIRASIHWYFPIQTPDSHLRHNSVTVRLLPGTAFLSQYYTYLWLVEALLHVFYHDQLWLLMSVDAYAKRSNECGIYSPWHEEPKSIVRLLHSLAVAYAVLDFYSVAQQRFALCEFHAEFKKRSKFIFFQVQTALAQIATDHLEAKGRQLVAMMSRQLEYHRNNLQIASNTNVPGFQQGHWIRWKTRNPHLARFATPPGRKTERLLPTADLLAI
jgi:HEXXH motif-containing protein